MVAKRGGDGRARLFPNFEGQDEEYQNLGL